MQGFQDKKYNNRQKIFEQSDRVIIAHSGAFFLGFLAIKKAIFKGFLINQWERGCSGPPMNPVKTVKIYSEIRSGH